MIHFESRHYKVQFNVGGGGISINLVAHEVGSAGLTLAQANRMEAMLKAEIPFEIEPMMGEFRTWIIVLDSAPKLHMEVIPKGLTMKEALDQLSEKGFERGVKG